MEDFVSLRHIARVYTDLPSKFGVPRQSGLADLPGRIVFAPPFRDADALRGIEGFSHLWLIFDFSAAHRAGFRPTVRPPRLGGNETRGVFATRSPFRPNPIGLSSVRLVRVEPKTPDGPVLYVTGVDLLDGTPLFDIKPYLPFTDCHPEAAGGFAEPLCGARLAVEIPPALSGLLPEEKRRLLIALLAEDPRPAYQDDPDRIYGFPFAGYEVRFRVQGGTATVTAIEKT